VCCGRRRIVRPDLVDQSLFHYDLACTKQQGTQNGPLLAAAQLEGALLGLGFERTEDAEPEWL
jgi:hypothetical protein